MTRYAFGWKRAPHAHKFPRRLMVSEPSALPPRIDLTPTEPPIWDQGRLGSCTGHGINRVAQFRMIQQGLARPFEPSRLMTYWLERNKEGTVDEDAGANIYDGIDVVQHYGFAPETLWPYDITKFKQKPSDDAFAAAQKVVAVMPRQIDGTNLNEIKDCLASGNPIVFGFDVFQSFEDADVARTGTWTGPKGDDDNIIGGHCVCMVGYDDDAGITTQSNSWSSGWGRAGHFTLPYSFVTSSHCSDFHTFDIKEVS